MKKYISLLLCLCMAVGFAIPAFGAESAEDMDVSAVLPAVTDVAAAEETAVPEEPAAAEVPLATEAPAETEEPAEPETPVETEVPADTELPAETVIPIEPEVLSPEETDIPAETVAPVVSVEESAPTLTTTTSVTAANTELPGLENITWAFEDGVLTFSGEGPIPDVPDTMLLRAPWYEYSDQAVSIVVEDGITGIGQNAFYSFGKVESVILPTGVEYIGAGAFEMCTGLRSINLPEGLVSIGKHAFGYCASLESVQLPSTIEEIGTRAFYGGLDHSVSTTVADREGYEFLCWYDADGNTYATAGEGAEQTIYPMWLRSFTGFEDVSEDAWYYDYVKYCYQVGLMGGMGDGTFDPHGSATRGQVVTVLYRLAGEPEVTGGSSFTDVYEGDWYYDAIAWAASLGIAQGMGDGTFAPNDYVTREQFVVFLYRYIDAMGDILNDWDERYYLTEDTVTDVNDISDWALEAEVWSMVVGLQAGYDNEDGTISILPGNPIIRGELAAFLTRYALDAYYYYCAEIAESLRGYGTDSVTEAFGQPDEKVDVDSTTQNWYYYDDCLGMEILWHEGYSMWYLNRWWFDY